MSYIKVVLTTLLLSSPFFSNAQIENFEVRSLFEKLKGEKNNVRKDFRPYYVDTLNKYEQFINSVLEKTTFFTGKVSFIGQTHAIKRKVSLKSSYPTRLSKSQNTVMEIVLKEGYQIIGNEGLSEVSYDWASTNTLEEYKKFDSATLRSRSVSWLYVQNKIAGKLLAVESPFVHRLHEIAFEEKNTSFEELLLELRSLIAFCLLLDEMQRKGYVEGALVIGTDHLDGLIAFARHVGIRFEVHRTSEAWAEYSKK
jgi:hypothetical protein